MERYLENPSQVPKIGVENYRSEGFALTGYIVPGCVDDEAWMLWGNSAVITVVVVLHPSYEARQSLGLRSTPGWAINVDMTNRDHADGVSETQRLASWKRGTRQRGDCLVQLTQRCVQRHRG